MCMIKPMPLELLIHKVEYRELLGENRYGKEYSEPVTLENVLVQPVSVLRKASQSNIELFNSVMFYDCTNSKPHHVNFTKGSMISFSGEEMEIEEMTPIYTFGLHHYELGLI